MPVLNKKNKQLYPAQNPTSTSPVGEQGATYSNIIYGNITIWRTEGVTTWSQPCHTWSLSGKFAHLYDFSIRSFDYMVCRSFHTLSRYDFRSNVIRPSSHSYIGHWFVFSRSCIHYSHSSPLFPCPLITFANSLDPVQYKQNVGSDLDTDHLTLW